MGGCREVRDIWFFLFGFWSNGKWRGWDLFRLGFWTSWATREYLLHDSFGKYWARLVACRVFGHDEPRNVNDPGEPLRMYCFRCERATQ